MANVMACPEVHVGFAQENGGTRNLKRTSRDGLPAPISASKRPALAAITNRTTTRSRQTPMKQKPKQIAVRVPLCMRDVFNACMYMYVVARLHVVGMLGARSGCICAMS